ncbi:DnaJ domain-containing protein [Zopfochytrium polystomum]|nr:DnaJ domain-containing protein [Zopfochytrium polystomum]
MANAGGSDCFADPDDYYAILSIPPYTASEEVIREAYIRQSLRWHPDRNPDDPSAVERFQMIAQAYYVLSDINRRNAFDKARKSNEKYATGEEKVNASTIFGSVFDELLTPEVPNPSTFWQPIGAAAGATLGFIFGNLPGAVGGYYAGGQLGKIRDRKGVSVYEAFTKLAVEKRAEILSELSAKLF